MNVAIKSITEQRDFVVSSSSLKEVRSFSREVFEKVNINQDLKDELVLAIEKQHKVLLSMLIKVKTQMIKWRLKFHLKTVNLKLVFLTKEDQLKKKM